MTDDNRVIIARHLTAIKRSAAAKAYEANMTARNVTFNWLLVTTTATQSALLFFITSNREDIATFPIAALILVFGIMMSLCAGLAHVRYCNEYAAILYLDMIEEIEGYEAIQAAKKEPDRYSDLADIVASWCAVLSLLSLLIGGVVAISGMFSI